MNKHLKIWAAAGMMALFMGTAAAAPQVILPKAAITASAADTIKDYKIGKLIYTVNETKSTATVKGLNREYVSNGIIDSVEIPVTVSYKTGKSATVTRIGERAFYSDRYLSVVTFASGSKVTTIGKEAFRGLFISSITLPNTVKTIGVDAFSACSNLSKVTLSNALTAIPESAFSGCKTLGSISIPATVQTIGYRAFRNNSAMTSVSFASGSALTSIGDDAFQYCGKLAAVTVPANVTSIGTNAFSGCTAMKTLSFASGSKLKTIGERAFENTQPASVTVPATVTSIGAYAFYSCDLLNKVTFASGSKLTSIGNYAFAECPVLASVTLPSSLQTIGTYAFHKCKALKTVSVPASVTTIGTYAFAQMDSLTTVNIGKAVTSIGTNAFVGDKSLTAINVNSSNTAYVSETGVLYTKDHKTLIQYPSASTATTFKAHKDTKQIESVAFSDLTNLKTVDFSATTGLVISASNFNSKCPTITALYIPAAENKASNGANVLKKYGNLFLNASLATLNGSPVVNNLNDNTKAPTFHSTIREAMYNEFEKYDSAYCMNQFLTAYAKFAVKDAYAHFGKSYNSKANVDSLTQVEKAYAIYKWVHNKALYDHDEFDYLYDSSGKLIGIKNISDKKNHCDASVFLHKKSDGKFYTVCDGYARAYALVMKQAGLTCYYVESGSYSIPYTDTNGKQCSKSVSHAFNCVKIGSYYYLVDPTSGADDDFLCSAKKYRQGWGNFSDPKYWRITKASSRLAYTSGLDIANSVTRHFGDLNRDSKVDINDKNMILKHIARTAYIPNLMRVRADVNGDGYIDVSDAVKLAVDYNIPD